MAWTFFYCGIQRFKSGDSFPYASESAGSGQAKPRKEVGQPHY